MILLLLTFLISEDPVEIIRKGFLRDINDWEPVGYAFDQYPYFEDFKWEVKEGKSGVIVVFRGIIPDEKAAKEFEKLHKYTKWRDSFKAMQLNSVYKLDDDKDKLAFEVHFLLKEDQSFSVVEGFLGVHKVSDNQWYRRSMSNKAIVEMIKAMYVDRDPYLALVKGLPFK